MNNKWLSSATLSFAPLALALGIGLGGGGLPVQATIATHGAQSPLAQADPTPSAVCQSDRYFYSFAQWQRLQSLGTLSDPGDVAQLLTLLQQAKGNPRLTQLAIDRWTYPSNALSKSPTLVGQIAATPVAQRGSLLPLVDQLVAIAQALPPGYNYAQSRALITAAQAYLLLGQPSRSSAPLQLASKTLVGIAVPELKAQVQWHLGEVWVQLGQPAQGQARWTEIVTTLKAQSRKLNPAYAGLYGQILELYIQRSQLATAEAMATALPSVPQRSEKQFRVAAAYLRSGQVKPAIALFNQALRSLDKPPRSTELERIATQGTIQFAQAGGVTTATQAAPKISLAFLRAQAWLAIAGEARQQKRPQEAAPALAQLWLAGGQGKQNNFDSPYGFGSLLDAGWGRTLDRLSRAEGYQAEFKQFVEQLDLQTDAAEFLIIEAVQANRFDEAQRWVPRPMILRNEAGQSEMQDSWLLWIARVAAEAGEPQQLVARAERILPRLTAVSAGLDPGRIPSRSGVSSSGNGSHLSNSPPLFLLDFASTPLEPEYEAMLILPLLQQQGQSAIATQLAAALASQAERLLSQRPEPRLAFDQPPIAWVMALEAYLRREGQQARADRLYDLQVESLKTIEPLQQRAQQLRLELRLETGVPLQAPEVASFIRLAEAVGVAEQPAIAQQIVRAATWAGQPELAEAWQAQAKLSPQDQVQLWIQRAQGIRYGGERSELLAALDKALALLEQVPDGERQLDPITTNFVREAYWALGQVDSLQRWLRLLAGSPSAQSLQGGLTCL